MNKSFIPYHLRQNKAIDRNLFIELLQNINRYFLIKKYEYISMGGPFLEDFKTVHANTGISKMVSFEMDENTFLRQKFNRPLSCIKLNHTKSSDFVTNYTFPRPTIIWLDFTTPALLAADLNDVFQLVGKLRHGDIVKITLNAHVAQLPSDGATTELEKPTKRFEYLTNLIDDYLPVEIVPTMMTHNSYPTVLFETLKLTIDKGMAGSLDEYFQPLTSFVYADGMQMMTLTGIILKRNQSKPFLRKTGIKKWDFCIINKTEPISISIPELSIKERMFLDSLLPKNSADKIQGKLKYLLAPKKSDSQKNIDNYVRYYKQFPYFSKIVL